MDSLTHLDIQTKSGISTAQRDILLTAIKELIKAPEFEETSFYVNGKYVGGRPNDRG